MLGGIGACSVHILKALSGRLVVDLGTFPFDHTGKLVNAMESKPRITQRHCPHLQENPWVLVLPKVKVKSDSPLFLWQS